MLEAAEALKAAGANLAFTAKAVGVFMAFFSRSEINSGSPN